MQITVHLIKPAKQTTISYHGTLVRSEPGYVLLQARWERPRLELGYVVFEPGDILYEHFYAERWYNVFEIRSASDTLKGWYCNITRPAQISAQTIHSEDLELDLFVPPDRQNPLRLDVDEFEARNLKTHEPATWAAAYAALTELEALAAAGSGPFAVIE